MPAAKDNETDQDKDKAKQSETRKEPPIRSRYVPILAQHASRYRAVALGNWVGLVKGQRVSVGLHTKEDDVPTAVREAMAADGVRFGKAAPPPPRPGQGAVILDGNSTILQ